MTVITRFAPSPTGDLHIGGARTALFAWLYTKQQQGKFVLRIEDTDKKRSTEAATQQILAAMAWLDLGHDGEPVYQSQRITQHKAAIQKLLQNGRAYRCDCSAERLNEMRADAIASGAKPRYNGHCRDRAGLVSADSAHVIRFKTPRTGQITVQDYVQGNICFSNAELDDLVLARSDGTPTYHLSAVVDDLEMGITDIIRGDDHLNNTPRQIHLFRALGATPPHYAHIPLILDEHGKRLSKRHGAANILHYRDAGYLPEALLNYLIRLGWSYGDQEIFARSEMMQLFDIHTVNQSAAAINPEKLLWLNKHYMQTATDKRLAGLLTDNLRSIGITATENTIEKVVKVQKTRHKTLAEMAQQSTYFFTEEVDFDPLAVKKHLQEQQLAMLSALLLPLQTVSWEADPLYQLLQDTAATFNLKPGKIIQSLRVAITGLSISPSITDTLLLLGKQRSLQRIQTALDRFA